MYSKIIQVTISTFCSCTVVLFESIDDVDCINYIFYLRGQTKIISIYTEITLRQYSLKIGIENCLLSAAIVASTYTKVIGSS